MHAQEEQPTGRQYDCVCIKYGFGRLHKVSHTAWHQHLASASSEEERQCIRTARLLGECISSLPTLTASSPLDCDNSVPPSLRRAEAHRGLAQRARENQDPNHYVGQRKRPRMQANSERLTGDDETAGCSLSQPAFPDQGDPDIPQVFLFLL
ncbi:hypothetical protein BKA82DRAFT_4010333 [Pisolithus tinctorius]|nr:hypothetical protein BKA82DRAFT_4010333 [Pisolithus tinctorius]